LIVVGCIVPAPVLQYFGVYGFTYLHAAALMGALLALVVGLYLYGRRQASPLATVIAQGLELARRLHNASLDKAQTRHAHEIERIQTEAKNRTHELEQNWQAAVELAEAARQSAPPAIERKAQRVAEKLERWHQAQVERLGRDQAAARERLEQAAAAHQKQLRANHSARLQQLDADHQARWAALEADWRGRVQPIYDAFRNANTAATAAFPAWQPELWQNWTPPSAFLNAARLDHSRWRSRKWRKPCPSIPAWRCRDPPDSPSRWC